MLGRDFGGSHVSSSCPEGSACDAQAEGDVAPEGWQEEVTEAEARARITLFLNPGTEPVLAAAEVEILIDMARRVDVNGVEPGDASWEETYDVNYAVAQGWLVKAGRLADRYLFMDAGTMYSRQQYYDHCMKQHQKFLMRCGIQGVRLVPDERLSIFNIPNNAYAPYYG